MRDNFEACLKHVFAFEGGYADHPLDPGGATNYGITRATLASWRKRPVSKAEVMAMSRSEAAQIYRAQYWDTIKGDELPYGIDMATFDYSVNSGPGRAARELQRVLGVTQDGVIGLNTLAAARAKPAAEVIGAYCDNRLAFLKRLPTWGAFGTGWGRRVASVRKAALAMARGNRPPATQPEPAPQKADPRNVPMAKTPEGKAGIGTAISTAGAACAEAAEKLAPAADGIEVVKWVFIALTVASVAFTLWLTVKRIREQEA